MGEKNFEKLHTYVNPEHYPNKSSNVKPQDIGRVAIAGVQKVELEKAIGSVSINKGFRSVNNSGASDASEALSEFKRICEGTRSSWNDVARKEWDEKYYKSAMTDAERVVAYLVEAERNMNASLRALSSEYYNSY